MRNKNSMRKTNSMKKNILLVVLLMVFGFSFNVAAQAPDPNDFFDDEPNPGDAPIDENVLLLLGAGLGYGLYLLKANKNKKASL
jgi:hypothetical protein